MFYIVKKLKINKDVMNTYTGVLISNTIIQQSEDYYPSLQTNLTHREVKLSETEVTLYNFDDSYLLG